MIVKICETSDLHYGANTFLTQKLYDHLKKNFVGFCKEKKLKFLVGACVQLEIMIPYKKCYFLLRGHHDGRFF